MKQYCIKYSLIGIAEFGVYVVYIDTAPDSHALLRVPEHINLALRYSLLEFVATSFVVCIYVLVYVASCRALLTLLVVVVTMQCTHHLVYNCKEIVRDPPSIPG